VKKKQQTFIFNVILVPEKCQSLGYVEAFLSNKPEMNGNGMNGENPLGN
jgi:hypothetical protein